MSREDLILNALEVVEREALKRAGAGPVASSILTTLGQIAAQALLGHAGTVTQDAARAHIAKLIESLPGEIAAGDAEADAYLKAAYGMATPPPRPRDPLSDELRDADGNLVPDTGPK